MTNGNKVRINYKSQTAIKEGVSKNEKNGFELVYPNSLKSGNSLLKGKIIESGDKFNIHMKILEPLHKITGWHKLEYTNNALNMLEKQFERLHEQRPHTDFNVKYVSGAPPPKDKHQMYTSLVRQILVERNNKTGKVVKMYLTDFDIQKTNKNNKTRKNLEKKVVEQFKDFIKNKSKNSRNSLNRESATRQLMFNSPGKRGRNNNSSFRTPPQSPRRKLF